MTDFMGEDVKLKFGNQTPYPIHLKLKPVMRTKPVDNSNDKIVNTNESTSVTLSNLNIRVIKMEDRMKNDDTEKKLINTIEENITKYSWKLL